MQPNSGNINTPIRPPITEPDHGNGPDDFSNVTLRRKEAPIVNLDITQNISDEGEEDAEEKMEIRPLCSEIRAFPRYIPGH